MGIQSAQGDQDTRLALDCGGSDGDSRTFCGLSGRELDFEQISLLSDVLGSIDT